MKKTTISAIAALVLVAGACIDPIVIAIDREPVTINHELEVDIDPDCSGDNAAIEMFDDGPYCVVTVEWSGPVLNFAEFRSVVKEKAEEHVENFDLDDATITLIEFRHMSAYMLTAEQERFQISTEGWYFGVYYDATLDDGDTVLRGELDSLDDVATELGDYGSFAPGREFLTNANDAFHNDTALPGTVSVRIRVPLDSLRTAVTAQPGPYTLHLAMEFYVSARAEVEAWSIF